MVDEHHAMVNLPDLVAYTLMLSGLVQPPPKISKRMAGLAGAACFQRSVSQFLPGIAGANPVLPRLTVGLTLFTDGYDPNRMSKGNRASVWVAICTLVIFDHQENRVLWTSTAPLASATGKAKHGVFFEQVHNVIQDWDQDAQAVSKEVPRMWSSYHGGPVATQIVPTVFLMDQPEKRQSNSLLAGNSTLHALFGYSIHLSDLASPLSSCGKCAKASKRYLSKGDFSRSPVFPCRNCMGWSVEKTIQRGKYNEPISNLEFLEMDAPGFHLQKKPGKLSFSLLKEAWEYAIGKFGGRWNIGQLEAYLGLLCVDAATVKYFLSRTKQHILFRRVQREPEAVGEHTLVAEIIRDQNENPTKFTLPPSPAAWSIGTLDQRVEAVMHLGMNVTKAIAKFVYRWATSKRIGGSVTKRANQLINTLKALRLSICPIINFKDDKYGGFVAETYRAWLMIAPWLFRVIEEDMPTEDLEADQVELDAEHGDPNVTGDDIRLLVMLCHQTFANLFSKEGLSTTELAHRFQACAHVFLSHLDELDLKMNPSRAKPIWQAKYAILGLLRVHEHFGHFGHMSNIFEGSNEGEGLIKKLRSMSPNAVKKHWQNNLVQTYLREDFLKKVGSTFGQCFDEDVEAGANDWESDTTETRAKYRRYTTDAEVELSLHFDTPVSVVVFFQNPQDSDSGYILGIARNPGVGQKLVLRALVFGDRDCLKDKYGFLFHDLSVSPQEITIGTIQQEAGSMVCGILLPDLWTAKVDGNSAQYAVVTEEMQHLGEDRTWRSLF
jgi:hypothetical protein